MSDNTTVTAGLGTTVATDYVNGAHIQRVKVTTGPDGTAVDWEGSPKAATATVTNVNDTASNVTLLNANTSRKGASIYNDSTSTLFLKYGATATSTSFTDKLYSQGYHEVFGGYTGQIDGIWDVDGSGAARMTELT